MSKTINATLVNLKIAKLAKIKLFTNPTLNYFYIYKNNLQERSKDEVNDYNSWDADTNEFYYSRPTYQELKDWILKFYNITVETDNPEEIFDILLKDTVLNEMPEQMHRGLIVGTDVFAFGLLGYNMHGKPIITAYSDDKYYSANNEVIPHTISHYSGFKDKNGKMIFKGDRLKHKWDSGSGGIQETISEVKYVNGCFVCDDKKRADFLLSYHALNKSAEIEIIGNIFLI